MQTTPLLNDVMRAKTTKPRPHLTGKDPESIRTTLNEQIRKANGGAAKECRDYTVAQLNEMLETFHAMRSEGARGPPLDPPRTHTRP